MQTAGRALVLLASHRILAAARLTPWFAARSIRLLSQGPDTPPSRLVAEFRADVDSVLFGTNSFWQGVDMPGEALSNVVVTRLPFGRADHPLLEARLEEVERRGGSRFYDHQLPEAVLKFKEGVGRLIRSKADRGVVAVLDPRVRTKRYGRVFLDSLPPCPRLVEVPVLVGQPEDAVDRRPAG
jgi:ATP-dependent DNA helicase DinG